MSSSETPALCDLCQQTLQLNHKLQFSCNHTLCFRCFPYLIFKSLESSGLSASFFNDYSPNLKCIFCMEGKIAGFPSELQTFFFDLKKIHKEQRMRLKSSRLAQRCESCEKKRARFCCLGCSRQKYCKKCLKIHQKNKKFSSHKILSLQEAMNLFYLSESSAICKCELKTTLEFFCLDCRQSVCKYCSQINHSDHRNILISEITDRSRNLPVRDLKWKIGEFIDDFLTFRDEFMERMESHMLEENARSDTLIDQFIESLNDLKRANRRKAKTQSMMFQEKFSVVQECFAFIQEEIEKLPELHPNKLYLLNRFFSDWSEGYLELSEFHFTSNKKSKLERIDELISLDRLDERILILGPKTSLIKKSTVDYHRRLNNFVSSIQEILNNNPRFFHFKMAESGEDNFLRFHSGISFIIDDETFLVYSSKINEGRGWLGIFNVSKKKIETTLETGDSLVIFASIYPQDGRDSGFKWLYSADDGGVFRIHDLSPGNKFREILEIKSKFQTCITSTMVFEDTFDEISKASEEEEGNIYAILGFNDSKLPLCIYRINGKSKGGLAKQIYHTQSFSCTSIRVVCQRFESKTFLLCLFSSTLCIYDLTLNEWILKYTSNGLINFPIIIPIKENNESNLSKNWLLFCDQEKEIVLMDLEDPKNLSKALLDDIEKVQDLYVWNAEKDLYLIISINEIQLIDITEMRIISSLKMREAIFLLRKILLKDEATNKLNEHLALFYDQSNLQIY